MTKKDVYPDSRNISVDKAKALFQKAIDLRLMERKDIPGENDRVLPTGFVPRFLDALERHIDRREAEGAGGKYVLNWYEMGIAILDYWMEISAIDDIVRLRDMLKAETEDFRLMCDLLVRIIMGRDKEEDLPNVRLFPSTLLMLMLM